MPETPRRPRVPLSSIPVKKEDSPPRGPRPPWSSRADSWSGLPPQLSPSSAFQRRKGQERWGKQVGSESPSRSGKQREEEPGKAQRYLGGLLTAEDMQSPGRIAVKAIAIWVFMPLIVLKIALEVSFSLLKQLSENVRPLARQVYTGVVLPCYRLGSRLVRLHVRLLHRCVLQPCGRLAVGVCRWCYSSLLPFLARTTVAAIEGSFRLLGRLLGRVLAAALAVWRAYVRPCLLWGLGRAWAAVKGIVPAAMACVRAMLRQLDRLVVQPALRAVAAAYCLLRHTVLPWAWAAVCRAGPVVLDAAKALGRQVHELLVRPTVETVTGAYRFLRHTLLPWAWETATSLVPAVLDRARCLLSTVTTTLTSTVKSLWTIVVVPACQDLGKLWTWAAEEFVKPLWDLAWSAVGQAMELAGATVAPAWQLAQTLSTAITQLALDAAAWSAGLARSIHAPVKDVVDQVPILISSVLAAARSLAEELQKVVWDLLLGRGQGGGPPVQPAAANLEQ